MIKKLFKLFLYSFGLWLFFAYIGPFMISLSPAWQHYNAVQEQYGLNSGALYYSDIPNIQEAEEFTRNAVKEGMKLRREKQNLKKQRNK